MREGLAVSVTVSGLSRIYGDALDGMARAGREMAPRAAATARGRRGEEEGRRKDDYE